jgi:hypothetical protein
MRCAYCNRILMRYETAHAVRFGRVNVLRESFIPDKDSADVVMCQPCGELLMKMIYIRMGNKTLG